MPKTRPAYAPEFRRQMVDLVRAGRDPEDLAREFEPTSQSIRHWVMLADRQEGRREEKGDVLVAAEREELTRLRRSHRLPPPVHAARKNAQFVRHSASPCYAGWLGSWCRLRMGLPRRLTKPNQLWVADITFVPTASGFLYLAVVLDARSRKIVGWSMANHLRAELVLAALEMAIGQRRPGDVIHHSDQGSQYTSLAFGKRCHEAGVRPSMGSVGDAYDNAMCESFFATLECELLDRRRFASQAEARMACFSFIEGWYNPVRLDLRPRFRTIDNVRECLPDRRERCGSRGSRANRWWR